MNLFNFGKRKINKNAEFQPRIIRDFGSNFQTIIEQDATSFACIDKIASEFASLNFGIYDKKTRQKVKEHSLLNVLKEPNLEDRHFNFFYQSAVDYFNGGTFWLKTEINGQLVSIFRLNANEVTIKRIQETNEKQYLYNGKVYSAKEILYIPSRFAYSTLRGGQSIFNAVSSVFKTSTELENFTLSSFKNGGLGKHFVLDVSGQNAQLSKEQIEEFRNSFIQTYGGAKNSSKPFVKTKGIEYSEVGTGVDNKSAELSENRKFQEHEISKIFGIPESLLTTTEASDLENTFTMFLEFAIKPLALQFQEAINSLLDENKFYFEFDYNGLLKVSLQQRIDAYIKQINNGLLSPNEARAKENNSPIEAGDTYFIPVNEMPLNKETIAAYMAKQKNEIANANNPTDDKAQHFGGGDDKQ